MKHIVIVGGGIAGQKFAHDLVTKKPNAKVTLVTGCSFAEFAPAMAYVLCNPGQHYRAVSANPEKYQAAGVTHAYGVVTNVDVKKKQITLSNQETLTYDMLVLSTGFRMPLIYPKPGATLQERRDEVKHVGAVIRAAGHVLIGGGGPVALELAGQMKVTFPDKKVSLVCSKILPQWDDEAKGTIEKQMEKTGIEVQKSSERCPIEPNLEACTVGGVAGDVFLPAFSQGPNTQFLESSGYLDASGRVKVNKFLQSCDDTSVYAIGVSDGGNGLVNMPKLQGQWETVAKNILSELKGTNLVEYKDKEPSVTRQAIVLLGMGKTGWGYVDFTQLPTPAKVCCCNGLCGFPCCPPLLCWPCCGPCLCGYCGAPPHGSGISAMMESAIFMFASKTFKGAGGDPPPPEQQSMDASVIGRPGA